MCWVAGMAIFATYADCDPLTMGYTSKIDEIVPFFVEDKFNYLPGMLGIFMASLFNGSFKWVPLEHPLEEGRITFCLFPWFARKKSGWSH